MNEVGSQFSLHDFNAALAQNCISISGGAGGLKLAQVGFFTFLAGDAV